ncbi:hypothetical protein NEFER03_1547 [Nematocida sp. LUAm3]|nr:hypothetical protein NEFER03_1547 [Nematocida sp. LUAm3]KAI5174580.1 hypothetical protein NEFER02_0701 [Nematocida sp. LUAm2]KAI5178014.1 hypothetical protein NEFER01_1196 [Nematocida sp. LUAm1]
MQAKYNTQYKEYIKYRNSLILAEGAAKSNSWREYFWPSGKPYPKHKNAQDIDRSHKNTQDLWTFLKQTFFFMFGLGLWEIAIFDLKIYIVIAYFSIYCADADTTNAWLDEKMRESYFIIIFMFLTKMITTIYIVLVGLQSSCDTSLRSKLFKGILILFVVMPFTTVIAYAASYLFSCVLLRIYTVFIGKNSSFYWPVYHQMTSMTVVGCLMCIIEEYRRHFMSKRSKIWRMKSFFYLAILFISCVVLVATLFINFKIFLHYEKFNAFIKNINDHTFKEYT